MLESLFGNSRVELAAIEMESPFLPVSEVPGLTGSSASRVSRLVFVV